MNTMKKEIIPDNNITKNYEEYLNNKLYFGKNSGMKPVYIPDYLFDFQKYLIEWALNKGRCGIFADCGLGKSVMELVWADNIVRKYNGNVLLLTSLAVGQQMVKEAEKFGIEVHRSRDGKLKKGINIANYEMLHHFNSNDFIGIICDESSVLKNFKGVIKNQINIFSRKLQFRLLATATAAPNDFIELGTSSEALGYLGHMDMLNKFFKNDLNNSSTGRYRGNVVKWRLKGHAHKSFWKWVTSWSRAIRTPGDIGFDDTGYILPALKEIEHELDVIRKPSADMLFALPAEGLKEVRDERRETIIERCEKVAEIVNSSNDFNVIWCNLNDEGDLLEKIIKDSIQVSGRDNDESKEEKLVSFTEGKSRVLITKPKIGAWGLNWQHCNRITFFPNYSYEQYYQAIRRCWRFGQKREVNVDIVYTYGDRHVISNLRRKQKQAETMFINLVKYMNESLSISNKKEFNKEMDFPKWLS